VNRQDLRTDSSPGAVTGGQWSDDAFLDALRRSGDPAADAAVANLTADGGLAAAGGIFKVLRANDTPLPADAPQPLHDFMASSAGLPPWVDVARLANGGQAFLRNSLPSVVVLLASSLPRGYAAPCICEILSISKDLERHPFGRLMGVVQLLINISDADAFQPSGRAIVTAQKLRLLHAGVRAIAGHCRPKYQGQFGTPVNHEDMLATIMGFSYLLIDGVRRLDLALSPEEAEDLYYLWRVFALLMGIAPSGRPHDDSFIPATIADAAAFYDAYVRRNDTTAERNAYGVVLTQDNLTMMTSMIWWPLRLIGLGFAPKIAMTELLTSEELARVGQAPLIGHDAIKAILGLILGLGRDVGEHTSFAARLSRLVLQGMVDVDRRGEVSFSIPMSQEDLRSAAFE
jgi:ER-bound oxygenase mpaB/B'/Rubber oxygenase, catalytic domain